MIGTADEPESDFDLLNVVVIRRGQKTDAPIFDYLAGVFNCNKAKIMEYVNIQDNETVLKGVEEMGGLGQSIMMKAMQQGMQEGMQQGMQKGMQKGIERAFMLSIQNLVKNLGMTEEEAMEALGIPESEHEKYRGQM